MIRIGTAGWSIPGKVKDRFPFDGASILARYAETFNAVEINSSFYRPHKPQTYARWAASTPAGFRFAMKLPKSITHDARLVGVKDPLERFLAETGSLGDKQGPILIQLPPSLRFEDEVVEGFLSLLRERWAGEAALEPRHASWFTATADALLTRFGIARVAADPSLCASAAKPGGSAAFQYWRWHGSPKIYASAYGPARLEALAAELRSGAWVIFDNTMSGAASEDALLLQDVLRSSQANAKFGE